MASLGGVASELGLDLGDGRDRRPCARPHRSDRRASRCLRRRAWQRAAPRPCAAPRPALPAARQAASTSAGTSKARMRPAELLARALDLVGAQRLAVRRGLALLGRRAVADDGLAGDQRRLVGAARAARWRRRSPRDRGRRCATRAPARGLEARDLVVGHGKRGRRRRWRSELSSNSTISLLSLRWPASEIASWLMPSIRQPSPAMHIGVVVDDAVAEPRVEQPLGQRHADGVGEALAQRTGGRLDARRVAVLGMAGGLGAELAEVASAPPSSCRDSRSGAAAHRAASSRGRPTARSGRGPASSGAAASNFRNRVNSTVATSAMPIGMPGWPGLGLLHRIHGQRPDGVRHVLVRHRRSSSLLFHRRISHARPRAEPIHEKR